MLRLLPKGVVNYIYEIVHKSITKNIIHEYIQDVKIISRNKNSNEYNDYILYKECPYNCRYLFGNFYVLYCYVYKKDLSVCAKLPERYIYSLTRQELKSMSNKLMMILD